MRLLIRPAMTPIPSDGLAIRPTGGLRFESLADRLRRLCRPSGRAGAVGPAPVALRLPGHPQQQPDHARRGRGRRRGDRGGDVLPGDRRAGRSLRGGDRRRAGPQAGLGDRRPGDAEHPGPGAGAERLAAGQREQRPAAIDQQSFRGGRGLRHHGRRHRPAGCAPSPGSTRPSCGAGCGGCRSTGRWACTRSPRWPWSTTCRPRPSCARWRPGRPTRTT